MDRLQESTASLNAYSRSISGSIDNINAYTQSNDSAQSAQNARLSRLEESTSSLNAFSASTLGHISDINIKTGSFETRLIRIQESTSSLNSFFQKWSKFKQ